MTKLYKGAYLVRRLMQRRMRSAWRVMITPIIIGRNVRRSGVMCGLIYWRMNNELAYAMYGRNLQKWAFMLFWCGYKISVKSGEPRVPKKKLLENKPKEDSEIDTGDDGM